MSTRIAVAVVHGMGSQPEDFAARFIRSVTKRFVRKTSAPEEVLVFEAVHWAPELQAEEEDLWRRMTEAGNLDWDRLRRFTVHFLADVVAYQIAPNERATYDGVHGVFASTLRRLAADAGPTAPLCIVAHSLGTVIASNYLYDLQQLPDRDILPPSVRETMGDTPLDRGETLTLLYTLASPLALFNLRYDDYGVPVAVPSPDLGTHHPDLAGRWVNAFDPDDVMGWPLRSLGEAYAAEVTEDRAVSVGPLLTGWTPLSHTGYWSDADVHEMVADGLAATWRHLTGAA